MLLIVSYLHIYLALHVYWFLQIFPSYMFITHYTFIWNTRVIFIEICETKSVKIIFFDYRLLSSVEAAPDGPKNIFWLLALANNDAVTVVLFQLKGQGPLQDDAMQSFFTS